MTDNKLKLNNNKTELLVLHAYHRPSPSLDSVYADTELIKASESVRNIGVWFDKTLLMKKHVNSVCKTAFYQLRHLATIRRFLSYQHFEILIHAFVTSRLDYCNSLLYGLPQNLLQKLQFVQNSAARLLSFTRKTEHITPILKELHWLPVAVRIEFKILVLVFKAYHGIAPLYISDMITKYEPTRSLRSSSKRLLVVPRYNLKTYGGRAFSVNGPMLWNSLPNNIRETETLSTFKNQIKTFLFKRSFSEAF